MRHSGLLLVLYFLFTGAYSHAQEVRIGVLGIFHPRELVLESAENETLVVSAGEQTVFLQPGSRSQIITLRAVGSSVRLTQQGRDLLAKDIGVTSRERGAVSFTIVVPDKLSRKYFGILKLTAVDGELVPVIRMDLETAVASAVQAESTPGTPLQALEAQAIVSRSYYSAGRGRHASFDFCDLTHCQFLREPPSSDSPAARATDSTRGLVVQFDGKTVATMFTRSCAGHTKTAAEIGLSDSTYSYFSVPCDACYKNPVRWTRKLSANDAALLTGHSESSRLAVTRRLGWDAVPSNAFNVETEGDKVVLHGVGEGHGVGLCQRGARAKAARGANFREIIAHYFPNTTVRIDLQ